MSLWWGSDPFAELVAKATSELLPAGQEDIALNLEVCDQVRAKQVQPKHAMQVIKKRIGDANPNVVLLALGLTDICIKNGGDHFLAEVASREFMDNLTSVIKKPAGVNHDVKAKSLKLIQNWAQISEAKPAQMGYIIEVYRSLKAEGQDFPTPDPSAASSAAFVETLTAPEWIDGEVCMRCRTSFTTFNRKHHCRNCGNVFCQQCSTHTMALPWYGIGQDVRACDGCFTKKAPPKSAPSGSSLNRSVSAGAQAAVMPSGRGGAGSGAQRSATTGSKPKRSKREDDDLALAIKLSLQDSGASSSSYRTDPMAPSEPSSQPRATRQANGRMLEGTDADDDPDLAAAIAASLRDYAPPQPSAPLGFEDDSAPAAEQSHPRQTPYNGHPQEASSLPLPPSLDLPPKEVDSLLTFAQQVQTHDHQSRQYGIDQPPTHQIHALYEQANGARPKMARSLDEAGRRHGVLMSMHDKLSEAVRLYDRLLDAQMTRPAGYSNGPSGYANGPYGAPQPVAPYHVNGPGEPRYYEQPQHQASYPTQPPIHSPTQAVRSASGSVYPNLPSSSSLQQPQMTGSSSTGAMYPSAPPPAQYRNEAGQQSMYYHHPQEQHQQQEQHPAGDYPGNSEPQYTHNGYYTAEPNGQAPNPWNQPHGQAQPSHHQPYYSSAPQYLQHAPADSAVGPASTAFDKVQSPTLTSPQPTYNSTLSGAWPPSSSAAPPTTTTTSHDEQQQQQQPQQQQQHSLPALEAQFATLAPPSHLPGGAEDWQAAPSAQQQQQQRKEEEAPALIEL